MPYAGESAVSFSPELHNAALKSRSTDGSTISAPTTRHRRADRSSCGSLLARRTTRAKPKFGAPEYDAPKLEHKASQFNGRRAKVSGRIATRSPAPAMLGAFPTKEVSSVPTRPMSCEKGSHV